MDLQQRLATVDAKMYPLLKNESTSLTFIKSFKLENLCSSRNTQTDKDFWSYESKSELSGTRTEAFQVKNFRPAVVGGGRATVWKCSVGSGPDQLSITEPTITQKH